MFLQRLWNDDQSQHPPPFTALEMPSIVLLNTTANDRDQGCARKEDPILSQLSDSQMILESCTASKEKAACARGYTKQGADA